METTEILIIALVITVILVIVEFLIIQDYRVEIGIREGIKDYKTHEMVKNPPPAPPSVVKRHEDKDAKLKMLQAIRKDALLFINNTDIALFFSEIPSDIYERIMRPGKELKRRLCDDNYYLGKCESCIGEIKI